MSGHRMSIVAAVLAAVVVGGCADYTRQAGAERGLIVVLPGVQGPDGLSSDIRRGLIDAGVDRAVVVQPWGKPIPIAGVVLNQVDFLGARVSASAIADAVAAYQKAYPGRPVHIIGHSAGGALAVFVAESLASNRQGQPIDGLVLLSASISSGYDLTKALGMCRSGILNCYNPDDVALLGVGTAILGNLDGGHGASAGRSGFHSPDSENASTESLGAYARLAQHTVTSGGSAHFAATSPGFVAEVPASWIMSSPSAPPAQAASPSLPAASPAEMPAPPAPPQPHVVRPDQWLPVAPGGS
ncbi:MAG: hypothetical protein LLG01_02285 [Planctomycetaceae bacterium]|nr:hypothetical protein [Planctomycetaceae bacterium]